MDTVSDIYCHITNNHKISVVFKDKLLFLITFLWVVWGSSSTACRYVCWFCFLCCILVPRLEGQWLQVCFSHGNGRSTKEPSQTVQTHFKPLLISCLQTSHWTKQVLWLNPKSRIREVQFTYPEAKAKVWMYNSIYRKVNNWDQ